MALSSPSEIDCSAAARPLSTSEKAILSRDGLVVPDFQLDDALMRRIEWALTATLAALPGFRPEDITSPHIPGWNGMPAGLAALWLQVATHPAVVDMVDSAFGGDGVILWGSQLYCKPPYVGGAVPWHQDGQLWPCWPIKPLRAVTVWLALDDASPENGGMRYIPGSHKDRAVLPHTYAEGDDPLLAEQTEEGAIDLAAAKDDTVARGMLSIHDVFLVHGSGPNRSARRRAAFTPRYMPASSLWDRDLPGVAPAWRNAYGKRPIYLLRGDPGPNTGEKLFDLRSRTGG